MGSMICVRISSIMTIMTRNHIISNGRKPSIDPYILGYTTAQPSTKKWTTLNVNKTASMKTQTMFWQ